MKQGRASNDGAAGQKREPISHAVSPAGAEQLGNITGTARSVEPLYDGRGYKAPGIASHNLPKGSQGKH
ncbi:MAG: hypothetical protein E6Q97_19155 [Desulfurellales bacterium]|nr:MAG: hypothetical protein E6Q97_19155 [Desulfurellales bacterium]